MSSGCTLSPSRLSGGAGLVSGCTSLPATAAGFGLLPQADVNPPAATTAVVTRMASGRKRAMASAGRHVQRAGGVGTGAVHDRNGSRGGRDEREGSTRRGVGRLELLGRPLPALDRSGN